MTNQYHILTDEAPLDLNDTAADEQESTPMLYAGGSDGGAYPNVPDFEPHLHLMLMSAYWRQVEACPEQASSIADTVQESSATDYTPEAWLEYRKR